MPGEETLRFPAWIAGVAVAVKEYDLIRMRLFEAREEIGIARRAARNFFVQRLAHDAHQAAEAFVPVAVNGFGIGSGAFRHAEEERARIFIVHHTQLRRFLRRR